MRTSGSPAPQFFDRIVGVATCVRRPRRCDLSRGVVADDASGTVVFHLTSRDGDLLHKLALPFAAPMPPGTRSPRHAYFPPSTGPYTIAGVSTDGVVRLVRNSHFHTWSQAARPDGYADAIRVQFAGDPRTAVARGRH
jgi:peptide/nickel transport system substrate-binding protein